MCIRDRNKDIRITGAAAGASFEDIQSQLIDEKASSGWKEQIADAVDRVVAVSYTHLAHVEGRGLQTCVSVLRIL